MEWKGAAKDSGEVMGRCARPNRPVRKAVQPCRGVLRRFGQGAAVALVVLGHNCMVRLAAARQQRLPPLPEAAGQAKFSCQMS